MTTRIILILVSATLLASALYLSGSPVKPAPLVASLPKSHIKIEMYGDSTTAGAEMLPDGTFVQSKTPEPEFLQQLLQKEYGNKVVVVNKGIGGLTAPELLWGSKLNPDPWEKRMAASDADIVVVNLGINDAYTPWVTDKDFAYCYTMFNKIAKDHGKMLIIETPHPIENPKNVNANQALSLRVETQRKIAAKRNIMIIDHYQLIQQWLPNWRSLLSDGTHGTAELYQRKAWSDQVLMEPVIKAYLQSSSAALPSPRRSD